ncbi:MAG TPA: TIGR01621 family pseudouridine synthase [Pseudomonadales bacterium]|nr:TIGR01621 family pseudouridine synthase [Pseudomonadales bacterium]
MIPVFEHADFFVFNKPAGASFHSEDGAGFFAALAEQYPQEKLFPVHRLDKMTSGLLLVARNKRAAQSFTQLFDSHTVQKTYLALSDKKPSKKQGAVVGDMARSRDGNWKLLRSRANPAITAFTSHGLAPGLRLFILQPKTGRTHQLRVVMKALGSPILGDARYGGTPADRGYLHAASLQFAWQGQTIHINSTPDSGEYFDRFAADIHCWSAQDCKIDAQ